MLWSFIMPATIDKPPRRETLNIRIRSEERGLIDRAAEIRGQSRTDFILEAAHRAAEETLLDRVSSRLRKVGGTGMRMTSSRGE
jgi:uncharacterized protein (DUF1778 family)